jgi:sulfite oxidase
VSCDLSRRALLRGLAAGLAATGCGVRGGRRASSFAGDGKQLITRLDDPYCGEPDVEELVASWLTPVRDFFVLDHGDVPRIDPEAYELAVEGEVRRPARFTLRDLARFPAVTIPATLMCAGNRRREHDARRPVKDKVLWGAGAIGNARWTGIRLADLLDEVGLDEGARAIWLDGADRTPRGRYGGSIPVERVRDPGAPPVLLVFAMNGEALPEVHGAPLRALVPGFIGARSIKWLHRIAARRTATTNPHFIKGHRAPDGRPLWELPLNAAICAVEPGRIAGYAIAGTREARAIAAVEVSLDGGRTWFEAELGRDEAAMCWRLWSAPIPARRRPLEIAVRAIDSAGDVQPPTSPWNEAGYLYHGWSRLRL